MIRTGMCSVTFREESVDQVIKWTKEAGLDGIEWGADVHVIPGDLELAVDVALKTQKADLEVLSYGSYYRAGATQQEYSFTDILQTAKKLGAPSIRIWAGKAGSDEVTQAERKQVVEDIQAVATLASEVGIEVHLEYHGGTLTDTSESAKELLEEINHSNVSLYWQPAVGLSVKERIASIQDVKPFLKHVHVFHWLKYDRLALSEGVNDWELYLDQLLLEDQLLNQHFLLEFVKDEEPFQFKRDAQMLNDLITQLKKRVL
ncbi:sugar phosphate isomerase/epimerase family protein [Alkalicoccobacillus gibsonii]|uniref:sugar phosphate isomerase/epimerase family protein n=1 Tax=Alkalicoccobacillus gibsonii TaxID=79881 RepID=UPI00351295A1